MKTVSLNKKKKKRRKNAKMFLMFTLLIHEAKRKKTKTQLPLVPPKQSDFFCMTFAAAGTKLYSKENPL